MNNMTELQEIVRQIDAYMAYDFDLFTDVSAAGRRRWPALRLQSDQEAIRRFAQFGARFRKAKARPEGFYVVSMAGLRSGSGRGAISALRSWKRAAQLRMQRIAAEEGGAA